MNGLGCLGVLRCNGVGEIVWEGWGVVDCFREWAVLVVNFIHGGVLDFLMLSRAENVVWGRERCIFFRFLGSFS